MPYIDTKGLRELVAEWRESASLEKSSLLEDCADSLTEFLNTGSVEGVVVPSEPNNAWALRYCERIYDDGEIFTIATVEMAKEEIKHMIAAAPTPNDGGKL